MTTMMFGTLAFHASSLELRALEVDAVLSHLASHARTSPGRYLCETLPMAQSASACRHALAEVEEALHIEPKDWPPRNNPLALVPILETLRTDGSIGVPLLAEVAEVIDALSETSRWVADDCPRLEALAALTCPPERLASRFVGAFQTTPDGGILLSSDAFPVLSQRRAAVALTEATLKGAVQDLMKSGELDAFLSEPNAAPQRRDGRLVVPVTPAHKRAAGVEVALSRSGQTVFVEPHALVPFSAATRAAQAALATCEAKLLKALCGVLIAHAGPLCDAVEHAANLDSVLARASLGMSWDGCIPYVGEAGCLYVHEALHPLLAVRGLCDRLNVKGNNLALRAAPGCATSHRQEQGSGSLTGEGPCVEHLSQLPQGLMLTGPNGGGKSVVLKTAALYAVLVRLAIPLPCASPSAARPHAPRVDFFTSITTDLADAQSLADGASSFAAHLRSCKRAIEAAEEAKRCGGHALVVLDEPGTATDPVQGAAIAQAVMEALLDQGALLLAATHSDSLKAFALGERRIAVGAMARSEDGSPLYTVLPGAVGSSHALDAATKEGIPTSVLRRAGELLPNSSVETKQLQARADGLVAALQERLLEAEAASTAALAAQEASEAARRQARTAAAAAERSLAAADKFMADRCRLLDDLILRLRKEGTDDLELLGETLRSLRVVQRDAAVARERSLYVLGLQPLADALALKQGMSVSYLAVGADGRALNPINAVVADDAYPRDSTVKVSIGGAPAEYVPRGELAVWYGGSADDFDTDPDAWTWMSGGAGGPSGNGPQPAKKQGKRSRRR